MHAGTGQAQRLEWRRYLEELVLVAHIVEAERGRRKNEEK
jgi:hypothetical protein